MEPNDVQCMTRPAVRSPTDSRGTETKAPIMKLELLVSPLARFAYFADYLNVARAELAAHLPDRQTEVETRADMTFLCLEGREEELPTLARLSFVQGIFEKTEAGLHIVDQGGDFQLPEELVYGTKYRGKTNELVTQLAINVGKAFADLGPKVVPQLLDPMAGRGTTMLWALRYGMDGWGIEVDPGALEGFESHVKKQCKLLRIKHKREQGQIGKRDKRSQGKFRRFRFGDRILSLCIGDSRDSPELFQKKRFHLLVADLPYGVQHRTPGKTRNPLKVLQACAPGWIESLHVGGTLTLVFNAFQPKREELVALFTEGGLLLQDFAAPHRMSESILRDLLVFKKA